MTIDLKETAKQPIGYTLVFLQFLLILLAVIRFDGFNSISVIILCILGLIIGFWAVYSMRFIVSVLPHVRSGQQLYVTGPYKYIRHPMYLAVLFSVGGLLLSNPSIINAAIWIGLTVVLGIKINIEEKDLNKHIKGYNTYAKRTKRLVPYIY